MKPPENSKSEAAAALIKGAVSAIPIAGSIIAEVGNLYLNPLEKRKQEWIKHVSQAIEDIQKRFSRLPESLEADEKFISFLYQATIIALKNHQQEKRKALSNALVSAADPENESEDLLFQFIRYIDELSVTHIKILTGLEKHAGQLMKLDKLEQVYDRFQSLTGQSIERSMFRAFVQDLNSRLLIIIGDIEDLPEYASKKSRLLLEGSKTRPLTVTSLGRTFLEFIRQGEP